jgi:acyl-[acyl-carrier-protein]-phospholipid O-acyltransferase / long-chain-fatty-acid--[acyl-carrier-protein] ligase
MTRYIAAKPFHNRDLKSSLFAVLAKTQKRCGPRFIITEDHERQPLSYKDFFIRTFALANLMSRAVGQEKRIGLMLPTSVGAAIAFFALHAKAKVPVMINFTAGQANVKSACTTAQISTVITSRRFVELGKMDDLITSMSTYVRIIFLEDLRKGLRLTDKLYAALAAQAPLAFAAKTKPEDIGVILFTSGSFGLPRGVVLSQANLIANTRQIEAHIDLRPEWIIFCSLPVFHSMGLMAGPILSLLGGLRSFFYPSPLHVKQIPELIKDVKPALLFTTDTFLNQYARQSTPDTYVSVKFIVSGAEKARDETRELFRTQFGGVPIIEGYGATEASPVVSVNTTLDNVPGTVGAPLPGIELRLDPVEGILKGGRLFVRGPNIMAGYIHQDTPDIIEAPKDGWHDTGDIVDLDEAGRIKILGRVKRFAKIAGEMVSLTAIERLAEEVWPENRHAVIAISDDKKGERLILITDNSHAEIASLADWAKQSGTSALAVPKKILKVIEVPVLGSGKTDYVTLQRLADGEARAA